MGGTEGVSIRRATVEDAAILADLAARLFAETFGAMNDPDDMRDYLASAFSESGQAAELAEPDRSVLMVFDADNQPVGYAMLLRGSRGTGVVAERPAELQRIYVDRRLHGRGVGDLLMARCVEQARAWNSDVLWLGVFQKNPRAIAFYQRSGFTVVGTQTFMLGRDLQHDFVMARPLS